MVHHYDEHVMRCAQPHDRGPVQRPSHQIERLVGLRSRDPTQLGLPGVLRHRRNVHDRKGTGRDCGEMLHEPPAGAVERGAQRFLPRAHIVKGALEGGEVESPLEPESKRDVVDRAVRLEPVDEPEPLLTGGHGPVGGVRHLDDRSRCRRHATSQQALDLLRECGDRRLFVDRPQRHLDPERGADARDELRRQERVPAGVEEIPVHVHSRWTQQLVPDHRQLRFDRRAGGHRGCGRIGTRRGLGKFRAIEFAVGRHRQPFEQHDRGRRHVVRQAGLQRALNCRGQRVVSAGGDRVGDEALFTSPGRSRDHHALPHRGMTQQRRGHFAELDSRAADLHLVVDAAENGQRAIEAVAAAIAGQVELVRGVAGKRVGDEPAARFLRRIRVSERAVRRANRNLAHFPDAAQVLTVPEHERLRLRHRPADRLDPAAGVGSNPPEAFGERRLGGSVKVDDFARA